MAKKKKQDSKRQRRTEQRKARQKIRKEQKQHQEEKRLKTRERAGAEREIANAKQSVEDIAGKVGITPEDMAAGLNPEQLQRLSAGFSEHGGIPRPAGAEGKPLVWGDTKVHPDGGVTSKVAEDGGVEVTRHTATPWAPFREPVAAGNYIEGDVPVNRIIRHKTPRTASFKDEGGDNKSAALLTYLSAMESAYSGTRSKDRVVRQQGTRLWTMLRDARIIEIPSLLYLSIHREVDYFTTTKIGQLPWLEPGEKMDDDVGDADYLAFYKRIYDTGRRVPFPEKLPFPTCYLGLNPPTMFGPGSAGFDIRCFPAVTNALGEIHSITLLGFLIKENFCEELLLYTSTSGSTVSEFYVYDDPNQSPQLTDAAVGWLQPYTLDPWIVTLLIEYINSHQTLVEEDINDLLRQRWNGRRKKAGIKKDLPPPYYTVIVRDKVLKDTFKSKFESGIGWSPSYRHDVRAHESVRFARGDLPLSEKLRKRLVANTNRRVYTTEPLSAEDANRLAKRGVRPKRTDEWMSVLVSQVKAHISPLDGSLPYIPGLRKFPKKKKKQT